MNVKTTKGLFETVKEPAKAADIRGNSLAASDVTLQLEDRIDPAHSRAIGRNKYGLHVIANQPQPKDDQQQTVMSPTNPAEAKPYHNMTFCENPKEC